MEDHLGYGKHGKAASGNSRNGKTQPILSYPIEIRKLIYTTNMIENLNRNVRKFTKTKPCSPTTMPL
jgi:transposase-like protein